MQLIAGRCTELESGGRMIDAILTNSVLPAISRQFLERTAQGDELQRVHIKAAQSDFVYEFSTGADHERTGLRNLVFDSQTECKLVHVLIGTRDGVVVGESGDAIRKLCAEAGRPVVIALIGRVGENDEIADRAGR